MPSWLGGDSVELNNSLIELMTELESIVGGSCYNPDSYNGYTKEYGKHFRYPICTEYRLPDGKREIHKSKYGLYHPSPEEILTMFYKFGANEMAIGSALSRVLEFLENRYGINFNELEENYQNKSAK